MEDLEKIQQREYERQQLLDVLKGILYKKEEESLFTGSDSTDLNLVNGEFWYRFVNSIFPLLIHKEPSSAVFLLSSRKKIGIHQSILSGEILPKIFEFSPVADEQLYILVLLLQFAVEQISQPFNRKIVELSVPPGREKFLEEIKKPKQDVQ